MAANSFARKLGIGVRIASQMISERAGASGATGASGAGGPAVPAATRVSSVADRKRDLAAKTRKAGHASRRFGEAVWGPFARVSRVLWLEVTGMFFGIFALFFAQNVYRLRGQWASGLVRGPVHGAEHGKLLIYAVLTLLFAYFTFTSFYRARRRSKGAGRV